MARIGVYGGSFNPPHLGHIFAARKAQQLLGLDKSSADSGGYPAAQGCGRGLTGRRDASCTHKSLP